MGALWALGCGAPSPYTFVLIGATEGSHMTTSRSTLPLDSLLSNVLLANLPQLVPSVLYVLYNAMLSAFRVQAEFDRLGHGRQRKPLRVSEPRAFQRSRYFLSLPLRYGIPFCAITSLMHWLVSQSLFLASITAVCAAGDGQRCPAGSVDAEHSFSTCGWSPAAMVVREYTASWLPRLRACPERVTG